MPAIASESPKMEPSLHTKYTQDDAAVFSTAAGAGTDELDCTQTEIWVVPFVKFCKVIKV